MDLIGEKKLINLLFLSRIIKVMFLILNKIIEIERQRLNLIR